MRSGETMETRDDAWPVVVGSPGRGVPSGMREFDLGIAGFLGLCLLFSSVLRRRRHRARWAARQKAKSWAVEVDAPVSRDIAPLEVRAAGPPGALVVLGDDDDQFRPRAREGVALLLDDGSACTLRAGTLLKCTFPGFTLLTAGGKGRVAVRAGTPFFVVAEIPAGASTADAPPTDLGEGHPFRAGRATSTVGPPVELVPILDRYECRLDPSPVRRRRLARVLPAPDPEKPPAWRPHLYPGIPVALMFALVMQAPSGLVTPLLALAGIVLATVEDALWSMSRED
ncbi:MAG: hypothetical protein JST00_18865 [Deltaproteobacteria bacterium]|nr:hypothetical protein [Deltaproteobacteria bacterium]